MAAVTCDPSPEVEKAYQDLMGNDGKNCAVIFKCNTQTQLVVIQEQLNNTTIPDIQYEIPETSPRFVMYRWQVKDPSNTHVLDTLVVIYFNPLNTQPTLKRTYQSTKERLVPVFIGAKWIEVNDCEDFTESRLHALVFGLTGQAAPKLEESVEYFGREVV